MARPRKEAEKITYPELVVYLSKMNTRMEYVERQLKKFEAVFDTVEDMKHWVSKLRIRVFGGIIRK